MKNKLLENEIRVNRVVNNIISPMQIQNKVEPKDNLVGYSRTPGVGYGRAVYQGKMGKFYYIGGSNASNAYRKYIDEHLVDKL
jgi:hypothetical protein